MPYLNELHVLVIGRDYVVTRPFRYRYRGKTIVVPSGFETDFASVPRVFRFLFTGHDRTRQAAVIHDYLYRTGTGSRKWADKVFLQAMAEAQVPTWKRYSMYAAVRAGGFLSWRGS